MVADVTNHTATYVHNVMPLKAVFAYEHVYFLKKGFKVKGFSAEQSLADLITEV